MDAAAFKQRPAADIAAARLDRHGPDAVHEFGRKAVGFGAIKHAVDRPGDVRLVRLGKPRRRFDQRLEHRLEVEGGAADDLQHVGGGGLLLQGFAQLRLAVLEHADVGVDADDPALLGATLADLHPAAIAELILEGARWIAMQAQPPCLPGGGAARSEHDEITLDDLVAELAEAHALAHRLLVGTIEPAEIAVAQDQAVVAVVERKTLGHRLDRLGEAGARSRRLVAGGSNALDQIGELALARAQIADVGVDTDETAVGRAMIADAQIDVAGEVLLADAVMPPRRVQISHPLLERQAGREHAALEAGAHHLLEGDAGNDHVLDALEVIAPDAVAGDHAVVGIPEHEPFGYALDRIGEPALRTFHLLDQPLALGHVAGRPHHAVGAPVGVAQRQAVLARPAPFAGPAPVAHFALEALALTLEVGDQSMAIALAVVRMQQRRPVLRLGEPLRVDLQGLRHPGRVVDLVLANSPVVHTLADRLDGEGVALFALGQRPLHLHLLGDIGDRPDEPHHAPGRVSHRSGAVAHPTPPVAFVADTVFAREPWRLALEIADRLVAVTAAIVGMNAGDPARRCQVSSLEPEQLVQARRDLQATGFDRPFVDALGHRLDHKAETLLGTRSSGPRGATRHPPCPRRLARRALAFRHGLTPPRPAGAA